MSASPLGTLVTWDSPSRSWIWLGAIASILAASRPARADGPQKPLVDVTIARAPGLAALQRRTGDSDWTTVCVPPCRLRLSATDDYRIAGEGVVDSEIFRLPPAERVRVDATAGSSMMHGIGTIFAVGGMLFAGGGGAILLLPEDSGASSDARSSKTIVGAGFLGMGLVTAALGVVLRIWSDTSVSVAVEP